MNNRFNSFKLFAITALTMVAFAANSVLNRLALTDHDIGPWSFTAIRFISGAIILAIIAQPKLAYKAGNWRSASALFLYGSLFSFAYLMLSAGTGALILFAAVQITMIAGGLLAGERLRAIQWAGTIIAVLGLIYLMSPSLETPPLIGALMMMGAGIGWGLYSLRGKSAGDPVAKTGGNFIRTALICLIISPLVFMLLPETEMTTKGVLLALTSGVVTSGLGYVIWYMALKDLTAIRAGIAQLTVPVIAAIGGMIFISEPMTWRFTITALVILGGVGAVSYTHLTLPTKA